MRRPKPVLTDQELEIMKIIWRRGQVTVRDVYEELLAQRKIAYTTVMTMMGILESKKYLRKSQGDRAYLYRPARPQTEVVSGMVREFVNRLFNGSAKPLLVHLAENEQLGPEELDEVRRMLKDRVPKEQ
jgi:predicted transcriptional regulator